MTLAPTPVPTTPSPNLPTTLNLLEHIPLSWTEQSAFQGVVILDIEGMRQDLDLPPITGEDDRSAKIPLITDLQTQGLNNGTLHFPETTAGSAFNTWGWDIADIDQVLLISDEDRPITIYQGDFSRPQIQERLLDANYQQDETISSQFTVFTNPNSPIIFATNPNKIIVMPADEDTLTQMMQYIHADEPSLLTHPTIITMAPYFSQFRGFAIFSPGRELVFDLAMFDRAPREIKESMLTHYNLQETARLYPTWDLMAITFSNTNDQTDLNLIYHYPSTELATQDQENVIRSLTELPSVRYRFKTWGDLITLEDTTINNNLIIAQATTIDKSLLGNALTARDYWGIMPVRLPE